MIYAKGVLCKYSLTVGITDFRGLRDSQIFGFQVKINLLKFRDLLPKLIRRPTYNL